VFNNKTKQLTLECLMSSGSVCIIRKCSTLKFIKIYKGNFLSFLVPAFLETIANQ